MADSYLRLCKDLSLPANSGLVKALEEDENCMSEDRISFRMNYLGNRGLQAVLILLGVNSRLKYLNLSRQGIHNSGAQNLAMTFYRHSSLTNLDLSYNRIATDGAKALKTLAEENEPLLTLDINHNDLDFRLRVKIEEILERKQRGTSRLTSVRTHSQVFENNIPTEMDDTESLAPPAFTPAESSQSLLSSRAVSQAADPPYSSFPRRPPAHRF
jgi:hypothetical protein